MNRTGRRAVFLDRDGVLSRAVVRDGKPYPPATVAELEMIPGAAESLTRLKQQGFLLLVLTNQPDVARGRQQRSTVEDMNRLLSSRLPVDDFFVCYHDDRDRCDCRKPLPGLLIRAANQYGVDLGRSYLVGDRWRDIDAGAGAGCKTVWIDCHYAEQPSASLPNAQVSSLTEAVDWILEDYNRSVHEEDLGVEGQAVR